MTTRKALGKGLAALIRDAHQLEAQKESYFQCPIDLIDPNPHQPRMDFAPAELEAMARSVRAKGVLTPLLVAQNGARYNLIAGERRWRAAQKAGLERVPVIVRETTPSEALELALIENLHRKDLNPIEEGRAYQKLIDDVGLTHETLAQRLGKDRSTVTNMLRLLTLPPAIQKDVMEGRLSMGHARVLAGVKGGPAQLRLRDLVLTRELSVRQLERLAQSRRTKATGAKGASPLDDYLKTVSENLKHALGTRVDIQKRGSRGKVLIYFYSDDELDRLIQTLS